MAKPALADPPSRPAPTPGDNLLCPALIGRAPVVAALSRLLAVACSGEGQTALIAGEAGIGKSRLVAELKQWIATLEPPGGQVLEGRCFALDRALPYGPWLGLLRAFAAAQPPGTLAAALGPAAPALVKLLPELADALDGLAPDQPLDPDQEKRRLFAAIAQLLARLATAAPLLVVIEDLHWSDETSLELLLFLVRHLAGRPILLLLTYRSDEPHAELTSFLADLDRERIAAELLLAPLSKDEVGAMISAIFALREPVHADFLDSIYALTEGNPLFVEEVLKSLSAAGDIFYHDGAWDRKPLGDLRIPRTVQVAVQQRTDGLSPVARHLLVLAAVAGRHFDFAVLQALAGIDEAALLGLVKELIEAQLVVEESAETFAFRHALTREAVYSDLLARERKALHGVVAAALERVYAGALDAHLADLIYHCGAAAAWPQVLTYAQRAGEKAQALFAPRSAVVYYTRALEAADHLGTAPPAGLYRARGQAYDLLGEFAAARDDYARLVEVARAAADPVAECQALLDLGWLWTGRDYERASSYFQRAIALARASGASAELAQILNRVGNWHAHGDRPLDARRCHEEALAIFQSLKDRHGQAETLDFLGITSYMGGDVLAGVSYYEQAVALWRVLDDRQGLAASLMTLGMRSANYLLTAVVIPRASSADCIREGEEALALAQQIGWRAGEAAALAYLALGHGPRGEFAAALARGRAAADLATDIDHRQWLSAAHLALGSLHWDLLALSEAQAHFERAVALAQEIGSSFVALLSTGLLASVHVAQQQLGRAAALLDAALVAGTPAITLGQRHAWAARSELALAGGDAGQALEILDRLIVAPHVAYWGEGAIPRLWHLRGLALAALGRPADALLALQAARAVAQAQGLRPQLWRIEASLGGLYYAQGRRKEAHAAYAAARSLVNDLADGITDAALRAGFVYRASAALPRPRPPVPERAVRQAADGLTAREREVAALMARGKSNRALAAELVLSERTVEKHVENIMGKLGLATRAKVAVWAATKGLAD